MTEQPATAPQPRKEKKHLLSYKAWIMILVISLLATVSHPPLPNESLNYTAGRFIGVVLFLAGVWALAALIYRALLKRKIGRE
jgi:hypothetical protein